MTSAPSTTRSTAPRTAPKSDPQRPSPSDKPAQGRIILLRGLTRESGHWGDFGAHLRKQMPRWECVFIDLPGAGDALQQEVPNEVGQTADVIRERIAELPPRPTVLLGLSYGGMVSLELAAKPFQGLEAVIFINTSVKGLCSLSERIRPTGVLGILVALASPSLHWRETIIHRMTSINQSAAAKETPSWVNLQRRRPVKRSTAIRQLVAASRYRAPQALAIPSFWLCAAKDRLVSAQCTRTLSQYYGGQMVEYPFSGHDLTLDAPQWTARKVRDFIQQNTPLANTIDPL